MIAFAWRSGCIEFGRTCPAAAQGIARGPAKALRNIVEVNARHGYEGQLLVPGIPEASCDLDAWKALISFRELVRRRLAGGTGWPASNEGGSAA